MPTERKIALGAELKELIERVDIAIATSYQGLSVPEQLALRSTLREDGAELRIVKNSLLRRAANEAGAPAFLELLDGPTALVVAEGDTVGAARAAIRYIRENPRTTFAVRNAVLDGALVDQAYVEDLATVPPRDELLARIAGGLTAKITELAGLLQGGMREFAGLVDARANQLETAEDGG